MDLEDLIDISSMHDLDPTYLRVIYSLPSQTKVPPPPITDMSILLSSSSLPLLATTSKKRKVSKTSTTQIQAMDLMISNSMKYFEGYCGVEYTNYLF